jgi:hypothetical protein
MVLDRYTVTREGSGVKAETHVNLIDTCKAQEETRRHASSLLRITCRLHHEKLSRLSDLSSALIARTDTLSIKSSELPSTTLTGAPLGSFLPALKLRSASHGAHCTTINQNVQARVNVKELEGANLRPRTSPPSASSNLFKFTPVSLSLPPLLLPVASPCSSLSLSMP